MFYIRKRTSHRMDGTFDLIAEMPEAYDSWTIAMVRAMELEAADLRSTHNGRTIEYDVIKRDKHHA